jgi:hypothetical protein
VYNNNNNNNNNNPWRYSSANLGRLSSRRWQSFPTAPDGQKNNNYNEQRINHLAFFQLQIC